MSDDEGRLPQKIVGGGSGVSGVIVGAGTVTSARVLVNPGTTVSFANRWTGTIVGLFAWDGSNDEDPDSPGGEGWIEETVPDGWAVGNPAGSANVATFDWPGIFTKRWCRQRLVVSAGTGTLSTTAQVK